jgi:transposase
MNKTKKMLEVEERIGKPIEIYLEIKYWKEENSTYDLSNELGVSRRTIKDWMNFFEIRRRNNQELAELYFKPTNLKTKKMLEVEERIGEPIEVYFRRKWKDNKESFIEIREETNIPDRTLRGWLRKFGFTRIIPVRNPNSTPIIDLSYGTTYNSRAFRTKCVTDLSNKLDKKPIELSTSDFMKKVRDDGKSYAGLMDWYERRFSCGRREALNTLLKELFDLEGITKINKKKFCYDKKESRIKAVEDLLEKLDKKPVELKAKDFRIKLRDDGLSHRGVLNWYLRNHNLRYRETEALSFILEDLFGIKDSDINLEDLLGDYIGNE